MSKAKPWPTVANRHRVEAIMKSGEIITEAEQVLSTIAQLRQAVTSGNVALALAITGAIEGRTRFMQEAAHTINATLESAPASEED